MTINMVASLKIQNLAPLCRGRLLSSHMSSHPRAIGSIRPLLAKTRVSQSITTRAPGDGRHIKDPLPHDSKDQTRRRFREFDLQGKVFAVTGGGRGLGLAMAEALVEAGANVYCIDRLHHPDHEFLEARSRAPIEFGGALHYQQMDVRDEKNVNEAMAKVAAQNNRLDGLIAAAGIIDTKSAFDHSPAVIDEIMSVNYKGVFNAAKATAWEMMQRQQRGSILLVASMSGIVANKGMSSAAYNSSKAAVIELTRCLAMEWGKLDSKGQGSIRVNCLCPGHILTPMVDQALSQLPGSKEKWEQESMLGRLSKPEEFRGAALFLLSDASSFITGSAIVADGGHTAW